MDYNYKVAAKRIGWSVNEVSDELETVNRAGQITGELVAPDNIQRNFSCLHMGSRQARSLKEYEKSLQ
jgi:hypothetical protein